MTDEYLSVEGWDLNPHRIVEFMPGGRTSSSVIVVGPDGVYREIPIHGGNRLLEYVPSAGSPPNMKPGPLPTTDGTTDEGG